MRISIKDLRNRVRREHCEPTVCISVVSLHRSECYNCIEKTLDKMIKEQVEEECGGGEEGA